MRDNAQDPEAVQDIRDRLIVALDLPDADEAVVLAADLRGYVRRVKVGLMLFTAGGPRVVRRLQAFGFGIFLDLKLYDIPHQIVGACREIAELGVDMFTVHASGGMEMMRAAVEAAAEGAKEAGTPRPAVLAVTVLTSLDDDDLHMAGIERRSREQVLTLARVAREAGADGVVCSPEEASDVREALGADTLIVTPGVRPTWSAKDDQVRIATPAEALAAGASHLVIGRPITGAKDPVAAVERIAKGG